MLNNAVKIFQDKPVKILKPGSAFDLIGLAIRKIQQNTVPVLNVFVFLVGILVKEDLIISRPGKKRKSLNIPALDKHKIQ